MTTENSAAEGRRTLRFPCSCVSATAVENEPWANVSKERKLQDGTKELILNAIYRSPRTIAQLAEELHLSQPTIHRHITELHSTQLIREASMPEAERQSSVERYYTPNFPVFLASERAEVQPLLEELASEMAGAFRRRRNEIDALAQDAQTPGPEYAAGLIHWIYTTALRMAREQLEGEGLVPPWPQHNDGSRWVWWAEEPLNGKAAEGH